MAPRAALGADGRAALPYARIHVHTFITMTTTEKKLEKVKELIKKTRIGMLTTFDGDGRLHSRPMATVDIDADGNVWFLTDKTSHKAEEIADEPRVCVGYADIDNQNYISIGGVAELLDDREKLQALWNPAYHAYFPRGLDDPDLCLLKVISTHVEYWDSPSSAVVHLVGLASAVVTGKRHLAGEHESLNLS